MSSDGKHVQRLRESILPVHESTVFPPREFRATQADVRDLVELINEYDYMRVRIADLERALTLKGNHEHNS